MEQSLSFNYRQKYRNFMKKQEENKFMLTPIQSIRAECIDCMGGYLKEVRNCGSLNCRSWPYRFGRRPTADMIEDLKKYYGTKGNDVD